MKYILIWWIAANGGLHSGSVEFNTESACGAALKQMLAQAQYPIVRAICAPKGE